MGTAMQSQKRMLTLSSALIFLGFFILIAVVGLYIYSRFQAWVVTRPRALVSAQIVWPDVPPLTPLPSPTPLPTPVPTPTPIPKPPVWIKIPKLNVERTIVPVGTVRRGGQLEWDADSLFATANRRDLVGHLEGSSSPGQPGNIILAGHNYNRGFYNWTGVFCSLKRLGQGDVIYLLNEDDERFTYQVKQVDQVPWQAGSIDSRLTHIAYLSSTQDETLTLVTCVGANFAPFPSRLYVIAKRVEGER